MHRPDLIGLRSRASVRNNGSGAIRVIGNISPITTSLALSASRVCPEADTQTGSHAN